MKTYLVKYTLTDGTKDSVELRTDDIDKSMKNLHRQSDSTDIEIVH